MKVRAKFRCDQITQLMSYQWDQDAKQNVTVPARTIKLSPVYGNGDPSHENSKFWSATPSGQIEMNVVNAAAADMFDVGKEYYIDFTAA